MKGPSLTAGPDEIEAMSRRKLTFGVILIVLGILLLGRSLGLVFFTFHDFFRLFLPLALIFLGFWLIVKKKQQEIRLHAEIRASGSDTQSSSFSTAGSSATRVTEAPSMSAPGKLRYSKTFGDLYIELEGLSLQSIEVTNFVGDIEIRVHGGQLVKGLNRMVVSGFIGDIRVLVPVDMPVFAQASSFIGDVELLGQRVSGFGNNIDSRTANYNDAESKLYIATNCFIGDVQVAVA